MNIAIDGPAGVGKSTVAQAAARRLGYIYVDSGALYRAVGLYALRRNVPPDDADAVAALLPGIRLELRYVDGVQRVLLNKEDVSDAIRSPACSMAASSVSAIPAVRAFLLDTQRALARTQSVVMDGRDIGTVVLPAAECKIYMTASPEERAGRRYRELRAKGEAVCFEEVLDDLKERDRRDTQRAVSPLKKAADAVELDNTGMSVERNIEEVLRIVKACEAKHESVL